MQPITKTELVAYLHQITIKDEPMIFLVHPNGTECSVEIGKANNNKYTLYGVITNETVYEQEIITYETMIHDVVDRVWVDNTEVDVLATIWITNQRQLSSKDKCKVATEQMRRLVRENTNMSLTTFCNSPFDIEKTTTYTKLARYIQHKTGTLVIDAPELRNVTDAQADHHYLVQCIKTICTMYTNAFN